MAGFDLVIRGGLVVDGSGGRPYSADVGVADGRITTIGKIDARGRQDIDADGLVVSPGFIDGHTHMDAQVFWDRLGRSSCYQGVTSVVMGNCGFTLAPCNENERALVVRNLEEAEEIPAEVLALGIPWSWESFREYLDAVAQMPKAINYAAQIGHSALRTWAMGERAFEEEATEADLVKMEHQLGDAIAAGAIGFTTSRSLHMTSDGRPVASRVASWQEVCRLVGVLSKSGGCVFQIAHHSPSILSEDPQTRRAARDELRLLALDSGVPIILGLNQAGAPEGSDILDFMASVDAEGGKMFGMSHSRGISQLYSFKTRLPFDACTEWAKIRQLPLREQGRLLRDPSVRQLLVAEAHNFGIATRIPSTREVRRVDNFDSIIYLEQAIPPNPTLTDIAQSRGTDPIEALIDLGLETNFNAMFMQFGRQFEDDLLLKAMRNPLSAMTFSDTGAHVTRISDCSIQTYLLAYWMRQRGEFTLQEAVKMITSVPASIWELPDRGLLQEGFIADLNVFDPEVIAPCLPTVETDFPGGQVHLQQKAVGIEATVVAGEVALRGGEPTGALSGQLIRGRQARS